MRCLLFFAVSVALAGPRMPEEQRTLHALNRLTFGPRAADVDTIRAIGLDRWIEQQLNPASIPENPVLEEKLLPLDSLRMSAAEMLRRYPGPQVVKAMADGRMSLPEDPLTRAAMQVAIARFEQRKNAADADAKPDSADVSRPFAMLAEMETMPAGELVAALEAVPPGQRVRLAQAASPELRRKIEILTAPMQVVSRDLTAGKLLRAIYSNRQLEEVLSDFWYNHFNVFLNKGADRSLVTAYERDVIRPHVLGKFKDLLLATAQSPAMLFYLDNAQSTAPDAPLRPNAKRRGLNENYGRELLELHTLGVDGGYTQRDVTEVARCFTGWTIGQPRLGGSFVFNPRMHDRGEKHVLGLTIPAGGGMEDGLRVIDLLAHHPSTARFIAKSLAVRFAADEPPPALVDRMAAAFTKTEGDLREVMRTMLASPEFWDPSLFRAKVKSPLEMVASAVRAVGGNVRGAAGLGVLLTQLGEPLYLKQEPTGYSNRGAEWMNSASLLARMNFANALAQGRVPGVEVDPAQFTGEAAAIERRLLLMEASAEARAAIQAGGDPAGAAVAGLTLGSPDFQRR